MHACAAFTWLASCFSLLMALLHDAVGVLVTRPGEQVSHALLRHPDHMIERAGCTTLAAMLQQRIADVVAAHKETPEDLIDHGDPHILPPRRGRAVPHAPLSEMELAHLLATFCEHVGESMVGHEHADVARLSADCAALLPQVCLDCSGLASAHAVRPVVRSWRRQAAAVADATPVCSTGVITSPQATVAPVNFGKR